MAMLKSERAALVATLFFEIPVAESLKKPYRRQFLAPGVPSRGQKGSGDQVRKQNEDPKGAQVHPEEPPGRPRGSSAEHFRVCGALEILSFMLRKSMIFDLGHFAGSGRPGIPPGSAPVAQVVYFRPPPPSP